MSLLCVRDLCVEFQGKQTLRALESLRFDIGECSTLGIVGESGSGKSTIALALMGLLPKQSKVISGSAFWSHAGQNIDLLGSEVRTHAAIRGRRIALISQNPNAALNPYLKIETQLTEHLIWHSKCTRDKARSTALNLLDEVQIKEPKQALRAYPHQFSGGQQQRIAIAMALITEPILLIADEPTTALDTTVQAQVLQLLQTLQRERSMSMIFISHDLRIVSQIADEIMVMQNGHAVETGSPQQVLHRPRAEYTRQLIRCFPSKNIPSATQQSTSLLCGKDLCVSFPAPLWRGKPKRVLQNINIEIYAKEIVGVVGESGAGKSTLARALLRLLPVESGTLVFSGKALHTLNNTQMRPMRPRMQMIFQDPYTSLNPRHTVYQILSEALRVNQAMTTKQVSRGITHLLEEVEMPTNITQRYPHQFSGGQRQRLSIARALATKPQLLIADEPLSSLDMSTQAQIIAMIRKVVRDRKISVMFISHDLSVVLSLCSRVIVMRDGQIVEHGSAQSIFNDPQHSFTRALINATPKLIAAAGAQP